MSSRRTAPDSKASTPETETESAAAYTVPERDVETANFGFGAGALEESTAAYTFTKNKVRATTIIKDIIIGLYLGVILICISILLDYSNIIHFQSAHHVRNSAYRLLDDPETLSNIEESAELKFMQQTEYESIRKELGGVAKQLADRNEYVQDQMNQADTKQNEIDSIRSEHTDLILKSKTVLELDKFCPECSWKGKTTCNDRVVFLMSRYKIGAPNAKVAAMEVAGTASCKKEAPDG